MKLEFKILISLCALIFCACDSDKIDSNIISSGSIMSKEAREVEQNLDKASYAELSDLFLDTSTISFDKDVLLIFGKNNCQYCDLLKNLIKENPALKSQIQSNFNPYYINISYSKTHKIAWSHKDSQSSVLTFDFASIFASSSTPTIVFINKGGEVRFIYPGFTPQFQELVTEILRSSESFDDYSAINDKLKVL